ncbi:MAG: DsbA family protein [Acidobacteriia bacterium]|nr:DsbA family protein [Terriglobia bacterium]
MNTFLVRRIGIFFLIVGMASSLAVSARPIPQGAGLAAGGAIRKGIGSTSAPITMEVFGDFQCPACRSFFESTVKQVIDDYVVPGKVYLVHRDFPLEIHPYAMQAARLANAAAASGQFEAIERALYDHQEQWSIKGNIEEVVAGSFPPATFKKFQAYEAQHLAEINASIDRDKSLGNQRSVNQTPTVFVTAHGKTEALPGGGVDYKLLKQYFDYLLRQ